MSDTRNIQTPADRVHVYFNGSPGLKDQIYALAEKERRSFSQMTCILAEEAIKARQAPDPLGEALKSGDETYKP